MSLPAQDMKTLYNPDRHHRRSIRLRGYDYSQNGGYFITICTQNRTCLFGNIVDGEMRMSGAGVMITTVWEEIPIYYPEIELGDFIVMPNHFHGIIAIVGAGPRACPNTGQSMPMAIVGAGPCACPDTGQPMPMAIVGAGPCACPNTGQPRGVAPTGLSLPDVVHRFKTMTTKRYTDGVKHHDWAPFDKRLWQRNYYEHVIRDEKEYRRIAEYIINNPMRWDLDELYFAG
jgi:REP element-mobilizing transposase RayT